MTEKKSVISMRRVTQTSYTSMAHGESSDWHSGEPMVVSGLAVLGGSDIVGRNYKREDE